ncbi:hypothetical protein [Agarilytica rhodophyticola]|uniref:ApeI family dehydratase n=1 Tax=Agarilytica rhodophyticola TaxID=1737490 RepID=UPI000B341BF7|nr:hypothetical protein [Agarilytica rhodophyticola]
MIDLCVEKIKTQFSSDEWPQFVSVQEQENGCGLTIDVNQNVRWFEGHFPGQPVLAGVVQTHWAAELGKFIFSIEEDFQRIDNLKFQNVIMPPLTIVLKLEFLSEKNALKFKFYDDDCTYSEGKIVFAVE